MNQENRDRVGQPAPDTDILSMPAAGTLWQFFRERVRRSPDAIAYRHYDKTEARWRDETWQAVAARVDRLRAALAHAGLKPGDRIAILLPNGIDWVGLDLAAHGSGLVVVGLYPHDTAAGNAYILGHADARLVLLDNEPRWQSLAPFRSEFPLLDHVWIRDGTGSGSFADPAVRRLAEALADAGEPPSPHSAAPHDLATLVYTSGTTGRPKGVMLSHFALLWNAAGAAAVVPPRTSDVFLSLLPVAHAFERTVGYYLPMLGGSTIAFARSVQELPEDFLAVRPTAMLGVPLLFERMAGAIRDKAGASAIARGLLQLAVALGWRHFGADREPARAGLIARALWPILDRLVAQRVRAGFGGRLRVAISGGAPLEQSVAHTLIALGVPVVEGYGLTEAAPVVAANGLEDNRPGSVGRPLRGIEVKLSEAGELLVRTPAMMKGYWKDELRTRQALDPQGWLSTGDIAEIEDGRIFIRGRLTDLIILSIGEKINPNVVEAELTRDPLFKQALVVGDRRPFLAAVIVLNGEAWQIFAASRGLDPQGPNHPASKSELLSHVTAALAALPRYAQVRAVHLTLEPWTIEAGQLTPTLKIKRNIIAPLFGKEIDALYASRQGKAHTREKSKRLRMFKKRRSKNG